MYRMRVCDSLRRAWDSNWVREDSKRQSPVVICRTSGAGTICTLPCHPQPQSELGKSTVKLSLAAWVDLFESIIDSRHISWRFYYYMTQNLLSQLDSTLVKVESSQKIWLSWVKCQPLSTTRLRNWGQGLFCMNRIPSNIDKYLFLSDLSVFCSHWGRLTRRPDSPRPGRAIGAVLPPFHVVIWQLWRCQERKAGWNFVWGRECTTLSSTNWG